MTIPFHALRLARLLLVLLLLASPALASAEVRAWLDRDRIELGETVTLNIETDGADRPDYAPLEQDFRIEQRSSRQSFERVGGRQVSRTLYAVALKPASEGRFTVPALQVGGERTQPLELTVVAASPARARGPAFIEAEVDDSTPYVQQAVGLRIRLHYSAPLVSGQLDQPQVAGVALRRVGNDLQYTREIGDRRYQVVERTYLLVPERSGRITLPAATFRGRGVGGGFFDDIFGGGQRALSADGPALELEVQPMPAAAPRPWLPLRDLRMRWLQSPDSARAGDAFTVELELVADGASAAQIDPPELVADQGAQVFPEPAEHDETVEDGRPRVRMVRRFSVLPARAGTLRIEAPALAWWDVGEDGPREAGVPALEIEVAAAAGGAGAADAFGDAGGGGALGMRGAAGAWALAALAFALLWLGTLAWALLSRRRAGMGVVAARGAGIPDPAAAALPGRRGPDTALRRALDAGDLGEVGDALCALASPPAADLDALSALLRPGPQREAIAALQRARWGRDEGGAAQARAAVREAFAGGADWLQPPGGDGGLLPPLYPR